MSKYKCYHCNCICDEDELAYEEWDEPRGEYWGMPCTEHMTEIRCPSCGSDDIDEYEEEEDEEEA